MNLQALYDLEVAKDALEESVEREVTPYRELHQARQASLPISCTGVSGQLHEGFDFAKHRGQVCFGGCDYVPRAALRLVVRIGGESAAFCGVLLS
jgi:hypothetical protein